MIETIYYLVFGTVFGAGLGWLIQRWVQSFQFKLDDEGLKSSPKFEDNNTKNYLKFFSLLGFSIIIAISAVWRELNPYFLNDILFITSMTIIAQIDLKTMYIEGRTIAFAAIMRMVWILYFEPQEIFNYLTGFFLGAGLLYFISFFYQTLRNRQGLGDGDAAVFGLIGLWIGWQSMWSVLLIAALSGVIISSFYLLKQRQKHQKISILLKTKIPFAPYLCFGGLLVYLLKETDYFNFNQLF